MKYSKSFMTALALLPLATTVAAPSTAKAKPSCKTYTKSISGYGKRETAYARVCRNHKDEWTFKRLSGSHKARAKLAEHIYEDLWEKGYGILVDYIDPYDHHYDRNDRYHAANYGHYKRTKRHAHKHTPYHYAKYKKRKRYERCDYN